MLDKNTEIRVLPGLHESSSPISASEGVRVVIHPPDTEPFPFTEGYDVPPGFSASLGIKPRKNVRIGPPHGKCADHNPFTPYAEEHYRSISCQKMCLQSHIIEKCNCTDLSLPKVPNKEVKSCRNLDSFPDSCIFNATEQCLNELLKLSERVHCARKAREMVTSNNILVEQCACHPPCEEVLYDVSYSLSKWPATGYEGDAAYMDVFYIVNFTDRFRDTPKHAIVQEYFNDSMREKRMKDFARLNVYIADSNVIKTAESPDYNTNQLVSDIGGQLGLWVGISIITLTEVMELLCNIVSFFFSTKLNHRKKQLALEAKNEVTTSGARPACNGNYCTMARGEDSESDPPTPANTSTSTERVGDRFVMTFTPRTYTPGNRHCMKPPKRSKQLFWYNSPFFAVHCLCVFSKLYSRVLKFCNDEWPKRIDPGMKRAVIKFIL